MAAAIGRLSRQQSYSCRPLYSYRSLYSVCDDFGWPYLRFSEGFLLAQCGVRRRTISSDAREC
jgi:hypothetical protein